MPRQIQPHKPNGHAGPNSRPNGHGPAIAERGGAPAPVCPYPPPTRATGSASGLAASDDASRTSVACAEALPATASLHEQASTVCEAYAAAATPPPHPQARGAKNAPDDGQDSDPIPPGEMPLPSNPADFVEEVHRDTDLLKAWRSLLQSKDEKVRQRAVEKLTEMRYKGAAALADDPQQFILEIDSAVARRAAEGAKK